MYIAKIRIFRKIRHKPEVRISLNFFFAKPEVDIKSNRRANFERIQSGRYGDIRVFPTKKYIFRVFKVIWRSRSNSRSPMNLSCHVDAYFFEFFQIGQIQRNKNIWPSFWPLSYFWNSFIWSYCRSKTKEIR